MSDLARTYFLQGRSFLQAGDPQKAVELLERAKVLAGDNRDLERQVLAELVEAYIGLGKMEQADQCRHRLETRFPQFDTSFFQDTPGGYGGARRNQLARTIGIVVAIMILFGAAIAVTVVVMQNRGSTPPPQVPAIAQVPAAAQPAQAPIVVVPSKPAPAPTPPASAPVAVAGVDLQDRLKDTVGLVVILGRYESTVSGLKLSYDIPFATGTCFAVDSAGVLLTNKHVTCVTKSDLLPSVIQAPNRPPLVKTGSSIIVCFGPDASDRYPAKVLHESADMDMAVLKINRQFDKPLTLAGKPCKQGDDILACGYPSIVQNALDKSSNTPSRLAEINQKWKDSGQVDGIDAFSRDSFNSTLTKGIVSAQERNIDGAGYLQMDATISHGNSGGPVMNSKGEVVGITTLGIAEGTGAPGKYNFALLIEQFRDELVPYLHK
jgi:S1-C subfamily serine protease